MVASERLLPDDERRDAIHWRLAALARLEPDWDSYDAQPPSAVAIDRARQFVAEVARHLSRDAGDRVWPTSISPLPSGGIELEWTTRSNSIAVDIGPEGRFGYLRKIGSGRDAHYEEQDDAPRDLLLSLIAEVLLPRP